MSSTRKDARWQLAQDTVHAVGLKWDDLTSVGQTAALAQADIRLNDFSDMDIDTLAARWNEPDPLDAQRDLLIAAIGYEPVDLSINGHPDIRKSFRTLTDRDGLIERILAAGFRAEVKS